MYICKLIVDFFHSKTCSNYFLNCFSMKIPIFELRSHVVNCKVIRKCHCWVASSIKPPCHIVLITYVKKKFKKRRSYNLQHSSNIFLRTFHLLKKFSIDHFIRSFSLSYISNLLLHKTQHKCILLVKDIIIESIYSINMCIFIFYCLCY